MSQNLRSTLAPTGTFVEEAKSSGPVAPLIERYHARGLTVAPPASPMIGS